MATPSVLTALLLLMLAILAAQSCASLLARWTIPAIVLELGAGFLLGNTILPFAAIAPLAGIAELGVLTLFFQVGLEVRGDLLRSRRWSILRTVALSSLVPVLALWPLQAWFGMARPTALLCLAVLSATGTGVTLRVLAQQQALQTPSARLLVGVSVLDDLPAIGFVSWAMLSGLSKGAPTVAASPLSQLGSGQVRLFLGLLIAGLAYGWVQAWVKRRGPRTLPPLGIMLLLVASAWLGEWSGLTSLMGALFGGVLLARLAPVDAKVERSLSLLSEVFLPLYFVSVGLRVEASTLLEPAAWQLAGFLVLTGVLSKLVCYLGIRAADRAAGVDPWIVIFGLIPRGVPGLVFSSTALAAGLITAVQFSALVLMVTTTTISGLFLLNWRLSYVQKLSDPTAQ